MASERGARISITDLGFRYGERPVLAGVALAAEPGEVVGLMGPNGSGKSTIVKILSGVLAGYTGSVCLDDQEVRQIARRTLARSIAVVPQEPLFTFDFTALEVVLMGRHPHLAGLAFEAQRDIELARESLSRCGAGELAARSIHELSSGERQRVVFARALAQEPGALLLDEPASFLDIRQQVELYELVREQAHECGRTVLTVLHDLNLAAEYCDRIYLLHHGRTAAGGRTKDVLTRDNLVRVFETDVVVDTHAPTGKTIVSPAPGARGGAGRGRS